ncbi:hypothetical protein O181_019316 [Austropuccinia psidii MF-1]|uniref:Uncharacterized protein n=1 Tax=Austropuccinia psidii MF-1 TaxID=1389203 RepID=A0A9Q3CBA6_9BASI|nr:hypothetical protein [Austropuccinia psidii MF-1]
MVFINTKILKATVLSLGFWSTRKAALPPKVDKIDFWEAFLPEEKSQLFSSHYGDTLNLLNHDPDPRWSSDGSLTFSAKHLYLSSPKIYFSPSEYLKISDKNFQALCQKIDDSIKAGNLVHMEDGEQDDHFQNGLGALRGRVPQMLLLRGGVWQIRLETSQKVWEQYSQKLGVGMPEIMTMHGELEEKKLADFDRVEGSGLISDDRRRAFLQSQSDTSQYKNEVKKAKDALFRLLDGNKFTTIVLKTAPTGLAEIIETVPKFKEKVAIVWTNPVGMRELGGYVGRFNYNQDRQASKRLIELGIPIIAASHRVGQAKMSAMVDESVMPIFKKISQEKVNFNGFKNLNKMKTSNGLISKNFEATASRFEKLKIAKWQAQEKSLSAEKAQLLNKEASSLDPELERINDQLNLADKSLGAKWYRIRQELPENQSFREYCSVDQYAEVVLDEEIRKESVLQVLQARLKVIEISPTDHVIQPILTGQNDEANVFILTNIDSGMLAEQHQKLFDWLANGEPKQSTVGA